MNKRLWLYAAALTAALGCNGGGRNGPGGVGGGGSGGSGSGGCEWDDHNPSRCPVCAEAATCDVPTYTDNKDGTVTSSCCRLVWQHPVDARSTYTWDDAKTYCAGLPLAGGGWRLPTIAELHSLVVLGQTPEAPTIDRVAFPDTPDRWYWSSSVIANAAGYVWVIYFDDGTEHDHKPDGEPLPVRCVR